MLVCKDPKHLCFLSRYLREEKPLKSVKQVLRAEQTDPSELQEHRKMSLAVTKAPMPTIPSTGGESGRPNDMTSALLEMVSPSNLYILSLVSNSPQEWKYLNIQI